MKLGAKRLNKSGIFAKGLVYLHVGAGGVGM